MHINLPRVLYFSFTSVGAARQPLPQDLNKKIQKNLWLFDFTFFGERCPNFCISFYKTWGFSNTNLGAKKVPYFC